MEQVLLRSVPGWNQEGRCARSWG